ncbi:MAG: hypothetical protein IT233_06780 [Bacteroidia bacterium]|nr:hypothetical protein [Bacteroidia bacterium]
MSEEKILFEEKQYLGYNTFSIVRRMVLCLFCFVGYYWSQNPKPVDVSVLHIGEYPGNHYPGSGELFFLLGMVILILSVILIFVLHLHTQVTRTHITLIGLWTKRMVRIELKDIRGVAVIHYKNLLLKQPVYNLHYQGRIRFYTAGSAAVEITDREGRIFRIGSSRAEELARLLESLTSS